MARSKFIIGAGAAATLTAARATDQPVLALFSLDGTVAATAPPTCWPPTPDCESSVSVYVPVGTYRVALVKGDAKYIETEGTKGRGSYLIYMGGPEVYNNQATPANASTISINEKTPTFTLGLRIEIGVDQGGVL